MGAPLTHCVACGEPSVLAARFCTACGAALALDPVRAPVAPATDGGDQRRLVTVLFAELAATATAAELQAEDPEALRARLDSCFAALVPVVERHGGQVDKIVGGELLAVFGAHEDDPERAVRAALAFGPALAVVAPGQAVCAGINTGEVLVGPIGPAGTVTVTGDPVNTAHRLVSSALPGEVLIGVTTAALVEGGIVTETRPPLRFRGKADLVEVACATGVARRQPRAPLTARTPMVGRGQELAEIAAAARRAFVDHRATVVLLTGDAGVGKTRLAAEAVAALPSPSRILWTTCPAYGASGVLEPLADLVRQGLGVGPEAAVADLDIAVARAVELTAATTGSDPLVLSDRLRTIVGLDREDGDDDADQAGAAPAELARNQASAQLVAAAVLFLGVVARDEPLVVVVDDLHWADDAVIALIDRATGVPDGTGVLVLGLARSEILERRHSVGEDDATWPIQVGPLTTAEAQVLLDNLLPDTAGASADGVAPATAARLLEAAGGNPLLLEQLVALLLDTEALLPGPAGWALTADAEIGLPDGIRALLRARLDFLPDPEAEVLALAAVVGHRAWRAAVTALADRSVEAELTALVDRGLLHEVTADDRPGDLLFDHSLTREVAYASLPKGDRARLHGVMARWLPAAFPTEVGGALAGLRAHHVEQAVRLSRDLDRTDPLLVGTAWDALVTAGRAAERRDALREAERWYTRALDLGTLDQGARTRIATDRARILVHLRRLDEARHLLEDLVDRAPESEDVWRTTAWLGAAERLSGRADRARERFDAASAAARRAGPQAEAQVLALHGTSELLVGRARSAEVRLRRAAALEDTSGGREGATMQSLGHATFLIGHLAAARDLLEEAATLHARRRDLGGVAWCRALVGYTYLREGRTVRSRALAAEVLEFSRLEGDLRSEALSSVLLAAGEVLGGDVEAGGIRAVAATRSLDELADATGQTLGRLVQAQACSAAGELARARTLLADALVLSARLAYVGDDARLLIELAGVELADGRTGEAERRARAALALVRAGLGDHDSGVAALALLATIVGSTDPAAGVLLAEEAVALDAGVRATDSGRRARIVLAQLLTVRGDAARAVEVAADAADGAEQAPRTAARAAAALADARAAQMGP